jgi:hypothetical protein
VDAAKDLTELVDLDPSRVDLVKNPANGFPILLMKAVAETAPESITPAAPAASDTDATKEASMPETPEVTQTPAAPEPQAGQPAEKSLAELVTEEVAKAMAPLTERNKALEDQMAALKSTPIPGGPVVTVPNAQRAEGARVQALADAARHERLAKSISGNPELTRYHEEKAAEFRKAANG